MKTSEKISIIRGKYVFCDFTKTDGGVINDGAVVIEGKHIKEIGSYRDIHDKYPKATVFGSSKDIIMPGIIDAHSHGQGLSYVQRGFSYDYLENCLFDWKRASNLPDELNAGMMALKHIRNGSTMLHVNHYVDLPVNYPLERVKRLIESYKKTGIRLTYSTGMKDQNRLSNDDEGLYQILPQELKDFIYPLMFADQEEIQEYYIDTFKDLRKNVHNDMSNIILGPYWAHGCSDTFLGKIRTLSEQYGGVPMHIHTLQTPYQREIGIRKYGKSLLEHLNDFKLVDRNLTLGHAVYLSESDIELLAKKEASITHHASCNLVMRNGIAPVYEMVKKGVNVALGIDEKQINDDEDVLQELKMIFCLHRMSSYDMAHTPALLPSQVLSMGTINAAKSVGMGNKLGKLQKGMLADIIVIDSAWIEEPWIAPDADILNTFIHRVQGRFVKDVFINGQAVMKDYKILSIDVEGLYKEVRRYMEKNYNSGYTENYDRVQQVKKYYQQLVDGKVIASDEVFYLINRK